MQFFPRSEINEQKRRSPVSTDYNIIFTLLLASASLFGHVAQKATSMGKLRIWQLTKRVEHRKHRGLWLSFDVIDGKPISPQSKDMTEMSPRC